MKQVVCVRRGWPRWTGGLLVAVSWTWAASAEDTRVPDEARQALTCGAAALNPLTVHYRRERDTAVPREELASRWKVNLKTFFEPGEYRAILQDQKKYVSDRQRLSGPTGEPYEVLSEWTYNQRAVCSRVGMVGYVHSLERLRQQGLNDRFFIVPYLEAAGFHVPNTPRTWDLPLQPLILQLIEQGGKLFRAQDDRVGDVPCLRLDLAKPEWTETHRFFLDPALAYALRRREVRVGEKLTKVIENAEFQRLQDRPVWLPRRCRIEEYTRSSARGEVAAKPVAIDTLTVTKLEQQPVGDDQFILHFEPGMVAFDGLVPEAKNSPTGYAGYLVPARKEELQEAVRQGIARRPGGTWRWNWFLGLNLGMLGLLLVGLGYGVHRFRHARLKGGGA